MSTFIYFKNDRPSHFYCTGPTERGGQAPKYQGHHDDHLGGSVASEVRRGDAESYAVYKKVGVVKKVSKPGVDLPFAVGQLVQSDIGLFDFEVIRVLDSHVQFPVITVHKNNRVDRWSINGEHEGGSYFLHKLRAPGSESVEFVPVAD